MATLLFPVFCLIAHALAAQITTSTTLQTSTVSLFLPVGASSNVAASIVSADASQTVYVLGCNTNGTTTTTCNLSPQLTITEGLSTLIYTNTPRPSNTLMNVGETISCDLAGATTSSSAYDFTPATSAVCVYHSVISGLGDSASTSTLASADITYVPVVVTAGQDNLVSTTSTVSTTSRAAAATVTRMADVGWLGVGVAALACL